MQLLPALADAALEVLVDAVGHQELRVLGPAVVPLGQADLLLAERLGLQPGRAEVILAGACIVRTILDKLGCTSLTVSDRGLRHCLIVDRFGLRGPVG